MKKLKLAAAILVLVCNCLSQAHHRFDEPKDFAGFHSVADAHQAYRNFRAQRPEAKLVTEAKFTLQAWHLRESQELTKAAIETDNIQDFLAYVSEIGFLNFALYPKYLRALDKKFSELNGDAFHRQKFYSVIAEMGQLHFLPSVREAERSEISDLILLNGPTLTADFRPLYGSNSDQFESWSSRQEFAAYYGDKSHVFYRGIDFKPGDLVLINQNEDSDAFYSIFFKDQPPLSHMGIVVFLEREGRTYPAVLEVYIYGVRVVPLSVFLSKRFSSYTEVYRFSDMDAEVAQRLSGEALKLTQEDHAFDYAANVSDDYYLTCSETVALLLRRSGFTPPAAGTIYSLSSMFRANIEKLGLTIQPILTPLDFIADSRVSLVGWIDNNNFKRDVVRSAVARALSSIFNLKSLDLDRLPASAKLEMYAVDLIRRKSILRFIPYGYAYVLEGLTPKTFPAGSPAIISLVNAVLESPMMTNTIEACLAETETTVLLEYGRFSPVYFDVRLETGDCVKSGLREFSSWFNPNG